jgi:hypothetical protein
MMQSVHRLWARFTGFMVNVVEFFVGKKLM